MKILNGSVNGFEELVDSQSKASNNIVYRIYNNLKPIKRKL